MVWLVPVNVKLAVPVVAVEFVSVLLADAVAVMSNAPMVTESAVSRIKLNARVFLLIFSPPKQISKKSMFY